MDLPSIKQGSIANFSIGLFLDKNLKELLWTFASSQHTTIETLIGNAIIRQIINSKELLMKKLQTKANTEITELKNATEKILDARWKNDNEIIAKQQALRLASSPNSKQKITEELAILTQEHQRIDGELRSHNELIAVCEQQLAFNLEHLKNKKA